LSIKNPAFGAGFAIQSLPIKSFLTLFLMTIAAIDGAIGCRLKWQLSYLGATVSASPVALKHLARKIALRSLAVALLKGHRIFN